AFHDACFFEKHCDHAPHSVLMAFQIRSTASHQHSTNRPGTTSPSSASAVIVRPVSDPLTHTLISPDVPYAIDEEALPLSINSGAGRTSTTPRLVSASPVQTKPPTFRCNR